MLDALIIGCGRIAGGYDETGPGDTVLTHAGAYRQHPAFRLKACIEPDANRRQAFAKHWGVETTFADLDACLASSLSFDVASVAAPTAEHLPILDRLLGTAVRAVLCEKPLATDSTAGAKTVAAYGAARRPLIVNYLRRFDPAMQSLKTAIATGTWGRLQSAVGYYGKGILHNGSHLVDLFHFLLGPLSPLAATRRAPAHEPWDATVDAELTTSDGRPVYLVGTDFHDYHLFEATLTFSRGQIALEEGGRVIRERSIQINPLYPEFPTLGRGAFRAAGQDKALLAAIDTLCRAATEGAEIVSSGETALTTERVCHRLLDLATPKQAAARS